MTTYTHPDVLDNGPAYIKSNCTKVVLATKFSTTYATVNGADKIAEATLVTGDFALSGATITGTATAGGASTLTDGAKSWTTNEHAGRPLLITGGTGAGQSRTVASNTPTQLTVSSPWTIQPSTDSTYDLYVSRTLTATLTGKSGGNALQGLADGTDMHIAFLDTTNSKVLHVTPESSNQAITSGNPVQFNSNPTYVSNQPTTV